MSTTRPQPRTIRRELDLSPDELVRRIGVMREPALLESGPGFGEDGRYSVFAAEPRLILQATGRDWTLRGVEAGIPNRSGRGDPLETLQSLLNEYRLADPADRFQPDPEDPRFLGGMIGYIGYDLAPLLERLPRKAPRDTNLPDLRFALYDTFVTVDRSRDRAILHHVDFFHEGSRLSNDRLNKWTKTLTFEDQKDESRDRNLNLAGSLESNFDRDSYVKAVERALDYIRAGDVFQVNLAQRFRLRGRVADPAALYERLRRASAAPYSAFLSFDGCAIASASPELFYKTSGGIVTTRPIKGTRPRGGDAESDRRLAEELAQSAKDRAELTMIVDLERNDLGRVCEYGSVRVVDPTSIETFSNVHHLVATIAGRLRPNATAIDLARAMFPGGSITGAPKIRSMEIIDEIEPCRRGVYTGMIGYFGRGGESAFNIAIRTLVVEPDSVCYHVGGGIVADSDPAAEYDETLAKGRDLARTLERTPERTPVRTPAQSPERTPEREENSE